MKILNCWKCGTETQQPSERHPGMGFCSACRGKARADIKRRARNADRRARNAILQEMCGTSARAAREDMGL